MQKLKMFVENSNEYSQSIPIPLCSLDIRQNFAGLLWK